MIIIKKFLQRLLRMNELKMNEDKASNKQIQKRQKIKEFIRWSIRRKNWRVLRLLTSETDTMFRFLLSFFFHLSVRVYLSWTYNAITRRDSFIFVVLILFQLKLFFHWLKLKEREEEVTFFSRVYREIRLLHAGQKWGRKFYHESLTN